MMMAFDLSLKMGLCSQEDPARVEAHLKHLGMKTKIRDITPHLQQSAEEIVELMASDKKAQGNKIGFILTHGIGKAFQSYEVDIGDVLSIVEESLK